MGRVEPTREKTLEKLVSFKKKETSSLLRYRESMHQFNHQLYIQKNSTVSTSVETMISVGRLPEVSPMEILSPVMTSSVSFSLDEFQLQ